MAVQNVALLVFLFPVVISIAFGAFVLADVLGQPQRDLNMWPFGIVKPPTQTGDKDIKIENLVRTYSTSTPIKITILVNNTDFNCGDLYITIYDTNISPKQVVAQNGFFSQCFGTTNMTLPINDIFSQKIDKPGNYEIVAQMNDKNYQKAINKTADFTVQ